jgi:hypothetical protein
MAIRAAGQPMTGAAAAALAISAAWRLPFTGAAVPEINRALMAGQFDNAMRQGKRGPHHLLTSGHKEDSRQQLCYRADSIEMIFDANQARYIDFLEAVLGSGPSFRQAGYISVRLSRGSRAEMSMHNLGSSRAVSIEVAALKGLPDNMAWMDHVQREGLRRGGRPHWGQVNKLGSQQVLAIYGQQLINWREALLRVSHGSTMFSNPFTRQRGLEPTGILREVTAVHKTAGGVVTALCGPEGSEWSPVNLQDAIREIQRGTSMYFTRSANRTAVGGRQRCSSRWLIPPDGCSPHPDGSASTPIGQIDDVVGHGDLADVGFCQHFPGAVESAALGETA